MGYGVASVVSIQTSLKQSCCYFIAKPSREMAYVIMFSLCYP